MAPTRKSALGRNILNGGLHSTSRLPPPEQRGERALVSTTCAGTVAQYRLVCRPFRPDKAAFSQPSALSLDPYPASCHAWQLNGWNLPDGPSSNSRPRKALFNLVWSESVLNFS